MKVTLRVYEGKHRTADVEKPEFLIGRAEDCDLRLDSPLVSRHHCVLTIQDGHLYVRDLQSSNGTGLNNRVLHGERPVHDGDTLWVAVTAIDVNIRRRQKFTAQVVRHFRRLGHPVPALLSTSPLVSRKRT